MQLFKTSEQKKSFVSTFSNPFKSESVNTIDLRIRNDDFWTNGKTKYTATVRFKNGDTSGNHGLEADDFMSLVQKVEEFLKNLNS
jgi:hypothetical protein